MTEQVSAEAFGTLDGRNVRVTMRTATREDRLESALLAIARTSVDESTDHAQLSALLITIARVTLGMDDKITVSKAPKTCKHGLQAEGNGQHIVKVWHVGQIDMPEVDECA